MGPELSILFFFFCILREFWNFLSVFSLEYRITEFYTSELRGFQFSFARISTRFQSAFLRPVSTIWWERREGKQKINWEKLNRSEATRREVWRDEWMRFGSRCFLGSSLFFRSSAVIFESLLSYRSLLSLEQSPGYLDGEYFWFFARSLSATQRRFCLSAGRFDYNKRILINKNMRISRQSQKSRVWKSSTERRESSPTQCVQRRIGPLRMVVLKMEMAT